MAAPTIAPELLEVLRCPADRSSIRPATPEEIAALNARIAAGAKANGGGSVEGPLEAALIRGDGTYAYPVREGIPVMLIEEAIAMRDGLPKLEYRPPENRP